MIDDASEAYVQDTDAKDIDVMVFANDYRKTNAGLHMLYTKCAVKHLVEIDKAIKSFCNFSNINMLGPIEALVSERRKLTTDNAAYAEADDILESINKQKGSSDC